MLSRALVTLMLRGNEILLHLPTSAFKRITTKEKRKWKRRLVKDVYFARLFRVVILEFVLSSWMNSKTTTLTDTTRKDTEKHTATIVLLIICHAAIFCIQ